MAGVHVIVVFDNKANCDEIDDIEFMEKLDDTEYDDVFETSDLETNEAVIANDDDFEFIENDDVVDVVDVPDNKEKSEEILFLEKFEYDEDSVNDEVFVNSEYDDVTQLEAVVANADNSENCELTVFNATLAVPNIDAVAVPFKKDAVLEKEELRVMLDVPCRFPTKEPVND